ESVLEAAILVHELFDLGVAARLGELRLDMAEPMADPAHRPGAGHDLGQDAAPGRVRDVLAEVADDHVLPAYDRARVRLLLAGDDLEQRRLAGTVRADDRDPPARGNLQRHVAEQVLRSEGLGGSGDGHQGHGPGMVAGPPRRDAGLRSWPALQRRRKRG